MSSKPSILLAFVLAFVLDKAAPVLGLAGNRGDDGGDDGDDDLACPFTRNFQVGADGKTTQEPFLKEQETFLTC